MPDQGGGRTTEQCRAGGCRESRGPPRGGTGEVLGAARDADPLIGLLVTISELLESADEPRWSRRLRQLAATADEERRPSRRLLVREVLALFGGMGSFDDLVLQNEQGCFRSRSSSTACGLSSSTRLEKSSADDRRPRWVTSDLSTAIWLWVPRDDPRTSMGEGRRSQRAVGDRTRQVALDPSSAASRAEATGPGERSRSKPGSLHRVRPAGPRPEPLVRRGPSIPAECLPRPPVAARGGRQAPQPLSVAVS